MHRAVWVIVSLVTPDAWQLGQNTNFDAALWACLGGDGAAEDRIPAVVGVTLLGGWCDLKGAQVDADEDEDDDDDDGNDKVPESDADNASQGASEGADDQRDDTDAGDPVLRMQGIVACPFYLAQQRRLLALTIAPLPDMVAPAASDESEERRLEASRSAGSPSGALPRMQPLPQALPLGVGDSVLLFLWCHYHSAAAPRFATVRVNPIKNAEGWRRRLAGLPFVRDWQGQRFPEQEAAAPPVADGIS